MHTTKITPNNICQRTVPSLPSLLLVPALPGTSWDKVNGPIAEGFNNIVVAQEEQQAALVELVMVEVPSNFTAPGWSIDWL